MNVSVFLARRFLSGRGGEQLLGTVSKLALFGVALGIAALVVAMGLMSGYRHELADKLAGTNAEVLAIPAIFSEEDRIQERLERIPGVKSVAQTAFAPGLISSRSVVAGVDVLVKGIELPAGLGTTRLLGSIKDVEKRLSVKGDAAVPALLGAGLAGRLGVHEGDDVFLDTATLALTRGFSPPRRSLLRVSAIVETGFSEVDDGWAIVPLGEFNKIAPPDSRTGIWELKLENSNETEPVVTAARAALGSLATVLDWKALNRDLFEALAVQQTLLFIGLVLIVAVAAGTIVSALIVLLAAKTREMAVLSALGADPKLIARSVRMSGLFLGSTGVLLGLVAGIVICFVLTATRAVRFPEEIARVYYLTWLPFQPEPLHVLGIAAAGLLLVSFSTFLPVRRATKMNPAEALRYE